jgi:hypothetical protein
MAYELKRVVPKANLSPASILQAKDGVISRTDVKNGGTLRVPAIEEAKDGDNLYVFVAGNGKFFASVTYNDVNLGKPLEFSILYEVFSEGHTIVADYIFVQGGNEHFSPPAEYELKD